MEYSDTEHYKRQMAEMKALLDAKKLKAQGGANDKMEENGKVKTVGNYNPVTRKWESGFREATVYEEPGEDLFTDKHPTLNKGEQLPPESQGDDWDPIHRVWRKAGEKGEEE